MTGKLTTTPVTLAIRTPKYDLMAFSSTGFGSVRCFDAVDNAWFLGKDVATALGYPSPIQAVRARVKSCDRKVFLKSMFNPPEQQTPFELPAEAIPNRGATFINEAGVCSLVVGSKHSAAKDFLPWVYDSIPPILHEVSRPTEVASEPFLRENNEHTSQGLNTFNNGQFGAIRTIVDNGQILFNGMDVAVALGYSNPRDALARHCRPGVVKHDVGVVTGTKVDGTPAIQMVQMNFITEGNLYRLIAHSKLPNAVKFEAWIFDEVIPTIIHTGSYLMGNGSQGDITTSLPEPPEIGEAKAKMLEHMVGPDELWTFTRTAKCFGVSISELTNYLRDSGYIEKNSDDLWLPTDKQGDRRFFEVKTRMPRCGKGRIFPQAYTTQAGRAYFSTLINAARVAGELYKGSEANRAAGAKRRKNPS